MEKFPITSISVAGVSNQYREFHNYWEIPEVAAELKKAAKQQKGSCFVFDRRKKTDNALNREKRAEIFS